MLGTALAYPATNGVFKNSKAVVDSETGWKIDSKIVEELHETEKAAGKPGIIGVKCIGIYASLENLKYYKNETAAITKKPDVLCAIYKFIQECYKAGKANELGIPVNVSQKLFDKLSGAEKRWFDRLTGAGFRPLLRANFAAEGGRRLISTKFRFNSSYGMPIEISLEKLVEQTGGAVLQVLENAKTTANGLLIVSREASDKIINMVLMKYW